MKIFMTRHGQTDWNVQRRLQGRTDTVLNDTGRSQADEVGKKIKDEDIDLIFVSPLKRAKETAEIINKYLNVDIIEDERLIERSFGKSEGFTKEYIMEKSSEFPEINDIWNYNKNVDFNDTEKIQDLFKRVYDFLDEITEKYSDKNILIVAHGGISVALTCYFEKYPLDKLEDRSVVTGLKNCEVAMYNVEEKYTEQEK